MHEETREKLRKQTVSVLLVVRSEYLSNGASPLKHWDQIQDRLRAAARTTDDVPGWVTALTRSLNLSAPSKARSLATDVLAKTVAEHRCASDWLDLVEGEHGYLMALAILEADKKRTARIAEQEMEWAARAAEVDNYKTEEEPCNSADTSLF